jgi:DNA-binding response OmpR family regulator
LVDYDTDSTEILSILLTLEGHQVEMASDGKAALQLAGSFKPQVVLLDTNLRDVETGRIVENLRWALPQTVLIATVDWQQEKENPLHWQEAGFDHCLVKPIAIEAVLNLFKMHFS